MNWLENNGHEIPLDTNNKMCRLCNLDCIYRGWIKFPYRLSNLCGTENHVNQEVSKLNNMNFICLINKDLADA